MAAVGLSLRRMASVGQMSSFMCFMFMFTHLENVACGLVLHTPNGTIVMDTEDNGGANSESDMVTTSDVQRFGGSEHETDHFQLLYAEKNSILIGAKNIVYNISMDTLQENKRIEWAPSEYHKQMCIAKLKTPEECQNYIRVIVKENSRDLYICGTNAFNPWCRRYRNQLDDSYFQMADMRGTAMVPYDPTHNNTAIFTGNRLFTATVADMSGRDALIYSAPMRTEQHDSQCLNEPNFVHSMTYGEQVYIFFREDAVENINCGKAVFSRVGRVCKNDQGGGRRVLKNTWTSFFKARLNCSLPGEYPFYFDEIQATTDLGQGNYMPSLIYTNRSDMIYAVFTTPMNSIPGSAICAFRFSDIIQSFEGGFKAQKSVHSNWLPVPEAEVPSPHPAKECFNDSTQMPDHMLNFIKSHPLMDKSVPAYGGAPVFVQTSFSFRLTSVAFDWQVYAADQRYYDIGFAGTDDGRVIKFVNKGRSKIDHITLEDIQVFENKAPVRNLKIYRDVAGGQEKLIVVSSDEIKSIPLHRCHLKLSCSECVALQDPYCTWVDHRCANFKTGIQSIETGTHPSCPRGYSTSLATESSSSSLPTRVPCPECPSCTMPVTDSNDATSTLDRRMTLPPSPTNQAYLSTPGHNDIPQFPAEQPGPCFGASTGHGGHGLYSAGEMATAIIVTLLLSSLIAFLAGYQTRRYILLPRRRRSDASNSVPSYLEQKAPPLAPCKSVPENNLTTSAPTPTLDAYTSYGHHQIPNTNIYQSSPDMNFTAVRPNNAKPLNIVSNSLKSTSPKQPNGSVDTQIVSPLSKGKTYL